MGPATTELLQNPFVSNTSQLMQEIVGPWGRQLEFVLYGWMLSPRNQPHIGEEPINSVVRVSVEQQRDSAIQTRIHSLPDSPPIQAAT